MRTTKDTSTMPLPVSTRIYPCRSQVGKEVDSKSIILVKQGALLEKIYFNASKDYCARIVTPGQLPFSSQIHLLSNDTASSQIAATVSMQSVHLNGTIIQSWHSDKFPSNEEIYSFEEFSDNCANTLNSCWQLINGLLYYAANFRLATLLLDLATSTGIQCGDGWMLLPLRLSVKDLADCIGATRETASLGINRFKRHGLVHTEEGCLVIASNALRSYREKL